MNKNIFVACDTINPKQIKKIIKDTQTKKLSIGYKLGLEFFYSKSGRSFLSKIDNDKIIFLDLKLNDIPNTCASAVNALKDLKNIKYLTAHISGGYEMLKAIKKSARKINKKLKILGVTVLTSLSNKSLKKYFKSDVAFTIFLVLLFLSWYMPYVSVRFSSENLSALFLVLGLVQYFKVKDSANKNQFIRYFLLGLFFGFSFYFRFQIAFAIAGFGLFILLVDRIKFMHLVWVLIGGILAIFLSICIDYWFYGKWIFSPFNYFTANITNDIASNYGVMPWWHYFTSFLLTALPPISVFLLLFFVIGFSKNLKNIFVWMFIPFLLAHIAVGHKELRFLFPLIVAFIYVSALGIDYFIESNKLKKLGKMETPEICWYSGET